MLRRYLRPAEREVAGSIFDLLSQGEKIAQAEPQLLKEAQTVLADLQIGLTALQRLIADVQKTISSVQQQ